MVVHIGQMSNGIPMPAADTLKPEEVTESFETVLVNAGKEKAEAEKPLDKEENCDKGSVADGIETDDMTAPTDTETVFVASAVVVPQIVSYPPADTVDADMSCGSVTDVASVEAVEDVTCEITDSGAVQFEEVEVMLSNSFEQDAVQTEAPIKTLEMPLEQEPLAETDLPDNSIASDYTNTDVNHDSANTVANDRSLLANAEETADGIQTSREVTEFEAESTEDYGMASSFASKQSGEQKQSVPASFEAADDFAAVSTDVQTTYAVNDIHKVRVENTEMSAGIKEQVITEISRNLEDVSLFKNEISFVLNPENLGKVSVKMAVENGILTVELSASNKETQSILAANLDSIKEALKNLSAENQVQNAVQESHPDYLHEHTEQNGGNNHYAQEEKSDEQSADDTQLTENFLAMLDMFGSEDI